MIRSLRNLNLTSTLVIFLVLTSILPLLVLGVTSYNTSRSVIQHDVSSYVQASVAGQQEYLDLLLQEVEGLITNVSGVEAIKDAVNDEGTYDPSDEYTRLATHAQIGYILSGYVGVRGLVSIDIFTPGGAHYHVGDTLNVEDIDRAVLDRIGREVALSDELVLWTGIEDNVNVNSMNPKVLTAARLFRNVDLISLQEKPGALLLVSYNVDSLYDHFSQVSLGPGAYFVVVDTHGRLVYHPHRRNIGLQVAPEFIRRMAASSGSFVQDLDGQQMLVTHVESDESGWKLAGLVPLRNLTASADAIRDRTMAVLLLSLAVIGLMAVWASRTLVQPIKRITEQFKQIQAGTFDWSNRLDVNRSDEVGELTRWFNAFLGNLEARQRADQDLLRAMRAADEARQAAEEANRAKSVFLANMSHELRTPLNAILGFTQLMLRDAGQGSGSLSPAHQANLETINSSGQHLLSLINDVLEMSKIEAGRSILQERAFDLHSLLDGLEEMFRLRAEQKDLVLAFERSSGLCRYVQADESKLRQVLINLLGNAIKFTMQGGVVLRIRHRGDPATALFFEIEDTGIGIEPDQMQRVFDAFVQTLPRHQGQEGTGLGLPISREFVRLMGGELTAQSEPGRGSIFRFEIPFAPADLADIESLHSQPFTRRVLGLEPGQQAPDGGPFRILVVEDIETNRRLLAELLRSISGLIVRAVVNGQEAIDAWTEWRPHLIWMDMRMPILDGYETTRRIREAESQLPRAPVRILALTASAFDKDRLKVLAVGCDGFVRKPFREIEIWNAMSQALGVRFLYQERVEPDPQSEPGPEDGDLGLLLRTLPPECLAELRQAAIQGDVLWIEQIILKFGQTHPLLVARLLELVNGFQYDAILDLLDGEV